MLGNWQNFGGRLRSRAWSQALAADAGLYANLALTYTLAGRINDAQSAINKSLQIDSADQISLTLRRIVQEIADGKRAQPRTLRELEGRK